MYSIYYYYYHYYYYCYYYYLLFIMDKVIPSTMVIYIYIYYYIHLYTIYIPNGFANVMPWNIQRLSLHSALKQTEIEPLVSWKADHANVMLMTITTHTQNANQRPLEQPFVWKNALERPNSPSHLHRNFLGYSLALA